MATTYEKIASVTVGSGGAADIEFTSIAADWDDLVIKISARSDVAGNYTDWIKIGFNSSTSSFSYRELEGNGSSASSFAGSGQLAGVATGGTATSNTFSNSEIYIPNYAGSTNKSYSADNVTENNVTSSMANILAGLWSNTAAITSIQLSPNAGSNFLEHSTAVLYGIKKS